MKSGLITLTLRITWDLNPGSVRLYLRHHMRILQSMAWSSRTCKALNSEKKAFFKFAEEADIPELPLTGDDLCLFAVWLWVIRGLKSPQSVKSYLSAVRTMHRRIGLDCHTPTSYGPLGQTLAGLARKSQHQVKKALPVTPTILNNLLQSIPHNPNYLIRTQTLTVLKATAQLLFQSMSRSSNMMPESRRKFDPAYLLKWNNIQRFPDGIIITVTKSKTNQFGSNNHEIPVAFSPDPRLCPIKTVTTLADMYGPENLDPASPVLCIPTDSGKFVPLKKSEFLSWFRSRLTEMGLPANRFSVHSFRHGSIQQAVLNENNRILVQLASGHASDTVLGYALIPPEGHSEDYGTMSTMTKILAKI